MDYVGSKNKLLGHVLEKPCLCSRGHILCWILMKLSQNLYPNNISDEFENGSC